MADILSLVPSCGTVAQASTVGDDLRNLAHSIQSGEWGDVSSAILLLNCGDGVVSMPVGRAMSPLEVIGLLEYAKAGLMWGDGD